MRLRLERSGIDGGTLSRDIESVSVGRGKTCTVVLPDLRVGELHLRIKAVRGGDCQVEAVGPLVIG